jgi:AcrR family transcriptional regulator
MAVPRARTRLDPEVRREQILDAAELVLSAREDGDITFEQVAEAAGVSRGLVYNYFGDKAGLLAAVYVRNLDRLVHALDAPLRASDTGPDRRLRAVIEVYLRFASDNPGAWRLLGAADAAEHPSVRQARRDHLERISSSWGETAAARVLGRGILGFLEAATVEWLEESDLDVDAAADLMHVQLWSGLAADTSGQAAAAQGEGRAVSATRQQYHATTLR